MKKLLFLVLSMAVAVSASAGVTASKIQKNSMAPTKQSVMVQQERHANGPIFSTPAPKFKAPAKADIPAGMAMVTLTAGDVWQDGSGYQMLLDADATAYGTIIPETGALTTSGNASDATYAEFEYKIPENADGALNTANIVINNSVSILVPAGTYDWCITNPTPGDRMWIASAQGSIGGRYDDFEFAEGATYVFEVYLSGSNDAVDLTILEPGVALTTPENLAVAPDVNSADVTWTDTDDLMWNLRYRPYKEGAGFFCDFEGEVADWAEGWILLDRDGDGKSWSVFGLEDGSDSWLTSASYDSSGALTPDNYLVTPYIELGGNLTFDVWAQDPSWPAEHYAVYLFLEDMNTLEEIYWADFIEIYPETELDAERHTITIDLSEYAGQKGHIAFRHFNVTDMFRINIDNVMVGDGVGPEPWVVVEGLEATAYTIAGLTAETTYEVQVQAAGSAATSAWTETVLFTTLAESAYMRGDVNNDGVVAIADVTTLINHVLMNDFTDGDNFNSANADCNKDGKWNISDVTALINYILSKQW